MIDDYPRALTIVSVVAAGLAAGVFFAFSTFVMQAVRSLPEKQGLSTMQAINKAAPASAWFMAALFGGALVCVALGISALTRLDDTSARYQLAGCALYLVGVIVTMAYHVPHNDALGKVDPASTAAIAAWRDYVSPWLAWNHVRTVASLGSLVAFVLALRVD
jgi:uncharacterized membrane protein